MFIRFLSGSRKGQVEEMKFVDAAALLADGRAERAYPADPEPAASQAPSPAEAGSGCGNSAISAIADSKQARVAKPAPSRKRKP